MDYSTALVSVLSTSLVPLIIVLIVSSKAMNRSGTNVIKHPKSLLYVSLFGLIIFSFVFFLCIREYKQKVYDNVFNGIDIFFLLLGTAFVLLYSYALLRAKNWCLITEKDKLIFTNSFGVIKEYSYSEITRVKIKYSRNSTSIDSLKIYIGKKKIVIHHMILPLLKNYVISLKLKLRKAGNDLVFENEIKKPKKKRKKKVKSKRKNANAIKRKPYTRKQENDIALGKVLCWIFILSYPAIVLLALGISWLEEVCFFVLGVITLIYAFYNLMGLILRWDHARVYVQCFIKRKIDIRNAWSKTDKKDSVSVVVFLSIMGALMIAMNVVSFYF